MGFKSKSRLSSQSNQSNQSNNIPFKVGGLIFDCEDDFNLFQNIDKNIGEAVNAGIVDDDDYLFSNVRSINVTETYPDAREEMDGLFGNATMLLVNENTRFHGDWKIGCRFFAMIDVIEFDE